MTHFYKKLILLSLLFFISIAVSAQKHVNVKGKVIEQETGLPLIGASVSIKENSKSGIAITGSEGGFLIKAHKGQHLVISFIGYVSQEVLITESEEAYIIAMDFDNKMLSEIVVTGAFGIKRSARELGTSAQVVENEILNQGKTVNPLLGLSSKVAGLRINMYDSKVDPQVQITLRGTRSLQRTSGIDGRPVNAPLYVVDGVPIPMI